MYRGRGCRREEDGWQQQKGPKTRRGKQPRGKKEQDKVKRGIIPRGERRRAHENCARKSGEVKDPRGVVIVDWNKSMSAVQESGQGCSQRCVVTETLDSKSWCKTRATVKRTTVSPTPPPPPPKKKKRKRKERKKRRARVRKGDILRE